MASSVEVRVPDIGDFDEVDVAEVLVKSGQRVEADESLITLESDKASMDIPAPATGVVTKVEVKTGDKVGEGSLIAVLEVGEEANRAEEEREAPAAKAPAGDEEKSAPSSAPSPPSPASEAAPETPAAAESGPAAPRRSTEEAETRTDESPAPRPPPPTPPGEAEGPPPHASPSVRRFARTLGADLRAIRGSGRKGRILKEDVEAFVKRSLTVPGPAAAAGATGIPEIPAVDFSRFGPVETKPLGRIRRIAARNVHRSWLNVPHVTQHDEADVTEMEAFRQAEGPRAKELGFKLTPLVFIMKGVVAALEKFPDFNASLDPSGESLILKRYFHLGIAVDTPEGLVVPVIREVDRKGMFELARELAEVSGRAREGKLRPADLQGACFTISSLGGIGGTAFTPIVNAPEVAILGVSRSVERPVYRDGELVPRLMMPLSLSYDHRVIDGATAVRFTTFLAHLLGDVRRLLL